MQRRDRRDLGKIVVRKERKKTDERSTRYRDLAIFHDVTTKYERKRDKTTTIDKPREDFSMHLWNDRVTLILYYEVDVN